MKANQSSFFSRRPSVPAEIPEETEVLSRDPDALPDTVRTAEDDVYTPEPVYY